jgi:hypothetical protein
MCPRVCTTPRCGNAGRGTGRMTSACHCPRAHGVQRRAKERLASDRLLSFQPAVSPPSAFRRVSRAAVRRHSASFRVSRPSGLSDPVEAMIDRVDQSLRLQQRQGSAPTAHPSPKPGTCEVVAINSSSGAEISRAPKMGPANLDRAEAATMAAIALWPQMTVTGLRGCVTPAQRSPTSSRSRFRRAGRTDHAGSGQNPQRSRFVPEASDILAETGHASAWSQPVQVLKDNSMRRAERHRKPLGVAGPISPIELSGDDGELEQHVGNVHRSSGHDHALTGHPTIRPSSDEPCATGTAHGRDQPRDLR